MVPAEVLGQGRDEGLVVAEALVVVLLRHLPSNIRMLMFTGSALFWPFTVKTEKTPKERHR